jgi:hypothetical protein
MTMQLHDIFACERMGRFEKTDESFVKRLQGGRVNQTFQGKLIRYWVKKFSGDQRTQYFEGVGAAEADNTYAATAGRGG